MRRLSYTIAATSFYAKYQSDAGILCWTRLSMNFDMRKDVRGVFMAKEEHCCLLQMFMR